MRALRRRPPLPRPLPRRRGGGENGRSITPIPNQSPLPLAGRGPGRGGPLGIATALALLLSLGACERERRNFHEAPPGATVASAVRMTELQPGPPTADVSYRIYSENAWAISEGQRLYLWFNCAGCHAPGGGGGMGPPLIDDEWIYGSAPENIFHTIQEGRPDGMPSFRGRISAADTWKLVAYVRYLSELTPPDTWPGRADVMQEANPEPEEGGMREGSEVPVTRRRR